MFIWGQFHKRCLNHEPQQLAWKLYNENFIQISQGPMSWSWSNSLINICVMKPRRVCNECITFFFTWMFYPLSNKWRDFFLNLSASKASWCKFSWSVYSMSGVSVLCCIHSLLCYKIEYIGIYLWSCCSFMLLMLIISWGNHHNWIIPPLVGSCRWCCVHKYIEKFVQNYHIDGLVQNYGISIANAPEIWQFCT